MLNTSAPGMARSLAQWVDYIQLIHTRTIDLGLERVAAVWARFKPERLPTVIALAGTNGKGSSLSMLESVYRQAGYATGAFTSPHLVRFNERICLNNRPVSDETLIRSFEKIERVRDDIALTFFEFNTLLALDIFSQSELDVILLEVGLGGRLDAVNIVENDLALITSIGIDHSAWLGDTRESIGKEKAGIIKPRGFTVIADTDAPDSLIGFAKQQEAQFVQAKKDYRIEDTPDGEALFISEQSNLQVFDKLQFSASLQHEKNNTAGVIAAVAMLSNQLPISPEQLKTGLDQQFLSGRLQLIESTPRILLDVSHNEDSISVMMEFIDELDVQGHVHAVFGALADKSYGHIYKQLKRRIDSWYLSALEGERGQTAGTLKSKMFPQESTDGADVHLFNAPYEAYSEAKKCAEQNDLIVIFGSFHLVGAIIERLDN